MRSLVSPVASSVLTVIASLAALTTICALQSRKAWIAAQSLQTPAPAGPAALWVLFIDDLHLEFTDTGRLRDQLQRVAETVIGDRDLAGSVSTGPSSISVDVTYDRARITSAIAKTSGAAMRPADLFSLFKRGPNVRDESRYRADIAIGTAFEIVKRLEKVRTRSTALIYVSEGYEIDPLDAGVLVPDTDDIEPASDVSGVALQDHFAALIARARRANVRIFPIKPDRPVSGKKLDPSVDAAWWQSYSSTTRRSLAVLAERTGGIALFGEADQAAGLSRIRDVMRR